jgi:hypothetical protein
VRVLICGDREWDDPLPISWIVRAATGSLMPTAVISGAARGVDSFAARSAGRQGVVLMEFPAKWDEHGKAAGPIRNQQMLDEGKPDVVFAFHDNLAASKGTADMVRRARKAGLPVYVVSRAP